MFCDHFHKRYLATSFLVIKNSCTSSLWDREEGELELVTIACNPILTNIGINPP